MFWYIFRQNFDLRAVRNGRKKGILDPKRLAGSVVSDIDFAGMSDGDGDVITPAPDRTKSGRMTFRNELTRRFGSKYRDADNTERLMGELMPLGKAFGIMAVTMFGPGLPTEKALHADRLEIWKNAAKYCLNEDTIQTVLAGPGVARAEGAGPSHAWADEHCPGMYQDGSAQPCPLLWPTPCILRDERRGDTVAPGPGQH
jgi:hypothetical protein